MNNKNIIYIIAIVIISYFIYSYINKKPEEILEPIPEPADSAAAIAAARAKALAETAANDAKVAAEAAAITAQQYSDAYARLNNPENTNIGNQYQMWQNKTYLTSEYVIYNNNLYKNTVQITTTNNTTPDKDNRWQKFIL